MLIEAPPSRYRVVERDGRLTVIDTQADGPPRSAREIIADGGEAAPLAQVEFDRCQIPRGRPGPGVGPAATGPRRAPGNHLARATLEIAPRSSTTPSADPPSLLRTVAATLSGNVRDGAGRLMLSTASWIDAKGPRDIALGPAGEQSLGALCLAAIAGFIALVVLLIAVPDLILPAALIVGVALSQSRPFFTRAIDALARI